MDKFLFSYILFFSFSSILFAQNNWEVINPKPSYRTPTDMYFVDNNRGYILNGKEILETLDAGISWHKKQDISSGVDFDFNGSSAYIVGGPGHVLQSMDQGNNWSQIQTGFDNIIKSVSIVDENTVYISGISSGSSSNSVLLKTEDGGANWELINFPNNNVVTNIVFTSYLIGHAACNNGKILKTIDGGNSWSITAQENTSYHFTKLHFLSSTIGFAALGRRGLYKTLDGGDSWNHIFGAFDISSINFIDENNGYVSGEDGLIFKTNNGGANWEEISFMFLTYYSDMTGIFFTDENHGYVAGERGRIAKTNNGGNSWNLYGFNYEDARQIEFINSQIGYVIMDDKIFKTSDGGNTWIDTELPITYRDPSNFDFVNENVGYVTNYKSDVYKTIDGAQNWDLITGSGGINNSSEGTYDIKFISENVGFVSGGFNQPRTFKTTNGGQSWEILGNFRIYNIQFITPQLGYAQDYYYSARKLYKTTDGGDTWSILYEPNDEINSFHFATENIGYLVGWGGMVEKTIDGGSSWNQLNIPWQVYDNVRFYSEDIGFVVNNYGYVYKTIDGGENWSSVLGTDKIFDMKFTDDVLYMAGSWGKIIKNDLDILGVDEFNTFNSEIVIYPNPSDDFVWLKSKNGKYLKSVNFFDISGRNVKSLPVEKNSETLKIDIADFATGLYLLKINFADETSTTKKLVIN